MDSRVRGRGEGGADGDEGADEGEEEKEGEDGPGFPVVVPDMEEEGEKHGEDESEKHCGGGVSRWCARCVSGVSGGTTSLCVLL